MANTQSAKRQAKKNIVKAKKNLARRTAIKTAIKKVLSAVEEGDNAKISVMFKDVESKLARAKGKKTLHPKTASRKISRLAKKIATVNKRK